MFSSSRRQIRHSATASGLEARTRLSTLRRLRGSLPVSRLSLWKKSWQSWLVFLITEPESYCTTHLVSSFRNGSHRLHSPFPFLRDTQAFNCIHFLPWHYLPYIHYLHIYSSVSVCRPSRPRGLFRPVYSCVVGERFPFRRTVYFSTRTGVMLWSLKSCRKILL